MNPPETLTPRSRAVNFAGTRATRHSRAGAIPPPPRARCSSSLRGTARSPVHQGAPPRAAATGGSRTRGCHSTSSAAARFSDSPYHSGVAVCGPMVMPAADRRATVGARAAGRGLVDTGADDSGCRPPSARHPAGKPTRGSARRRKAALRLGPSNAARSDGPRTRLLAGTGAAAVTGVSGAVADAVRPDRFRPGADPRTWRAAGTTAVRRGADRGARRRPSPGVDNGAAYHVARSVQVVLAALFGRLEVEQAST